MSSLINTANLWSPMIVPAYDQRYPIIFPAVHKPEPLQKVTVADKMTSIETSMWIWTLGYSSGWPEAEQYSKIFRENDIDGNLLPSLSLNILQNYLGIRNPNHCMSIKSAIDLLFPNTKERQFKAPFDIERGVDSKDERESLSSATHTNSGSVDVSSESVFSTTFTSSSGDISMNSGYNLAEYDEGCPSPNNLHRFKTLINLKVRAGMSLRDRKIGVLKKNEIVTVNEVQGRRARVTYIEDKETMTSGWVSLYSGTGTPFLERLNKAY